MVHRTQNQALEQTRDSVLRYGEVVGRELLNFVVRRTKPNLDLVRDQSRGQPRRAADETSAETYRAMIRAKSRGSWTSTGERTNPGPSRVTITSTA
jgi:hypothetical protein